MSDSKQYYKRYDPIPLDATVTDAIRRCRIMHPAFSEALHRILSHYEMGSAKRILLIKGASGTGKTTLRNEACRLINKKIEQMNTGLPAVSLSASPPEGSNFSFRVFYEQLLHELREPLVEFKMDPQERLKQLEKRPGMRINRTTAAARFALEKILISQPPAATLIDEAQHLGRNANVAKRIEHMDVIKSLSEIGTSKLILFGTLQAQVLQHLNGQLSRRIKAFELRPYDATKKGVQDFWTTFVTMCTRLRLPIRVEAKSAVYLRRATGGAIGLLAEWLQEAAEEAMFDEAKFIKLRHLKATQPAQETLDLIAGEVYEHDIGTAKRKRQLRKVPKTTGKKGKGRGNARPGRRGTKRRDKVGAAA